MKQLKAWWIASFGMPNKNLVAAQRNDLFQKIAWENGETKTFRKNYAYVSSDRINNGDEIE